jgi:hypothetical protein
MFGSRDWERCDLIARTLEDAVDVYGAVTVIHGDARGADSIAGIEARRMGLQIIVFPADWKKYGKQAGWIRNQQMLDEGHPDLAFGFTIQARPITPGTKDMAARAKGAGIPTMVLLPDGDTCLL